MGKIGWGEVGKPIRGGSGRFLQIESGEDVVIRILDEAPYTREVHKISQIVDGEEVFRTIPATDVRDDNYILKHSRRWPAIPEHNIRVLRYNEDGEPDGIFILSGGPQIFKPLKDLWERYGDIRKFDVVISKEGTKRDTQYHVSAAPVSNDIDIEYFIEEMEQDETLAWENVYQSVTPEDQQRMLAEAGLDVEYDPVANIAEEMDLDEALEVRMPSGKYGPEKCPPKGKTIGEIFAIDPDYVAWVSREYRSNDTVAAAARVVMENVEVIGATKKAKQIEKPKATAGVKTKAQRRREAEAVAKQAEPEEQADKKPTQTKGKAAGSKSASTSAKETHGDSPAKASSPGATSGTDDERAKLVAEINQAFADWDAMDIVAAIRDAGGGKTRIKDLSLSELKLLLAKVATGG